MFTVELTFKKTKFESFTTPHVIQIYVFLLPNIKYILKNV